MSLYDDPCAVCGHPRRRHWLHPGAGLRAAFRGQCLGDCPCERFVRDAEPGEADKPARAAMTDRSLCNVKGPKQTLSEGI